MKVTVRGVDLAATRTAPVLVLLLSFQAALGLHIAAGAGLPVPHLALAVPTVLTLHLASSVVHEAGHVLSARAVGLDWCSARVTATGLRVAVARPDDTAIAPAQRLVVGLAGPVVGLLAAATLLAATFLTWGSPAATVLLVAGLFATLDNVLNLLPFPGSDGWKTAISAGDLVVRGVRTLTARPGPAPRTVTRA